MAIVYSNFPARTQQSDVPSSIADYSMTLYVQFVRQIVIPQAFKEVPDCITNTIIDLR